MPEKILIVDDDHDTVEFLKVILTRQGYQTVSAKDGMEALRQANQELPDLIILDVMMPGLDGYEVARSLHRRPETALIPILMFTARAQTEDKVAGYEAGVDLYLTKPVHPLDLQANIKALLMQRQARKTVLADRGYVVGVIAAKGGQGVSTVALNLAVTYSRMHKIKTIAAELRPGLGTWADELNFGAEHGLARLLRMNAPELTRSAVEGQLINTSFGTRLMLAGGSSGDVELAAAVNQYEAIIHQLTSLAPLLVLDVGTPFLQALPIIEDMIDEMIVVTEPQILAVRRTAHLLDDLRGRGFGSGKPLDLVTLNHTRADNIMTVSQIETIVRQPVTLGFPPAPELVARAITTTSPLVVAQPEALLSLQFNKMAEIVFKHVGK